MPNREILLTAFQISTVAIPARPFLIALDFASSVDKMWGKNERDSTIRVKTYRHCVHAFLTLIRWLPPFVEMSKQSVPALTHWWQGRTSSHCDYASHFNYPKLLISIDVLSLSDGSSDKSGIDAWLFSRLSQRARSSLPWSNSGHMACCCRISCYLYFKACDMSISSRMN